MARPAHTLLRYHGVITLNPADTVLEEFSFGIRCQPINITDPNAMNTLASACKSALISNLGDIFANRTAFTKTEVVRIGSDGKWQRRPDGSFIKGEHDVFYQSALSPGDFLPLQTALVASLETSRGGATGRGRIFLPWPDIFDVSPDRMLAPGNTLNVANSVAALLTDLRDVVGLTPVVASDSAGVLSNVTSVRVGSRPDTQRLRNNDRPEVYSRVVLS